MAAVAVVVVAEFNGPLFAFAFWCVFAVISEGTEWRIEKK